MEERKVFCCQYQSYNWFVLVQRDEIIFEECPLITGPPQSLTPNFCANCSLTGILLSDCKAKCGLKICSEKCQNIKQRHDKSECEIVKQIQDKSPNQWLTVFRVLQLKNSNPHFWTKFLMLEDHIEDRKKCPIMKRNKSVVYDVLKNNLSEFVSCSLHFFTKKQSILACSRHPKGRSILFNHKIYKMIE